MIRTDNSLAIRIAQDLVRIDSVNPDLVPSAAGEAAASHAICELMRSWGLEVIERELKPGRLNAVGILRGSGGGRTLLFNGHTDVVSVTGMAEPFAGTLRDGRVYGRGAFDMKGSLAATLAATHALVQSGVRLRGDVVFTYVADEEYASIGTEGIVADIRTGLLPRPDAAINTEPSDLKLGIAHKGFAWAEIDAHGMAAHGSRPDLGVDAIVQMGKVLTEIGALQQRLSAGDKHRLLGTGSVHASLIQGGRELSSYPDRCTLQIERRTVPPESEQTVANELGGILERLAAADPAFSAASRITFVRNPWEADVQSAIARLTSAAIERATGRAAEHSAFTGWLDSALLGDAGIPTVVFGPSGEGAHALDEWVDGASLGVCAQVYADVIEAFCG
ncbi:MAG: ArgE/DapE family deacylase [Chloroflexi bacterium]|nr:ArgE/DapE family deacylase [Chloroflexota bacterium]